MSRPRALVLALVIMLTGAFLSVPSATASSNHARHHGFQRFVVISTSFDETAPASIAANGPIHAKGTDVVTGEFTDRFEFPKGNVNIRHRPFTKSQHETFDKVTCYGTYRERGKWWTTSGTGAYDDVKGHGHYRVSVQFFGCDPEAEPDVVTVTIRAAGPLSY